MKYVEAPIWHQQTSLENPSIFLAGGITACPDWQMEIVRRLEDTDLTIFNPRRTNFPIDDPGAAEEQIRWEHHHLKIAKCILFWFAAEAIQPIALYELGYWTALSVNKYPHKPLFIGAHPDYVRHLDVCIQTKLAKEYCPIADNLTELGTNVLNALYTPLSPMWDSGHQLRQLRPVYDSSWAN